MRREAHEHIHRVLNKYEEVEANIHTPTQIKYQPREAGKVSHRHAQPGHSIRADMIRWKAKVDMIIKEHLTPWEWKLLQAFHVAEWRSTRELNLEIRRAARCVAIYSRSRKPRRERDVDYYLGQWNGIATRFSLQLKECGVF